MNEDAAPYLTRQRSSLTHVNGKCYERVLLRDHHWTSLKFFFFLNPHKVNKVTRKIYGQLCNLLNINLYINNGRLIFSLYSPQKPK